jgi:serine/threonine-protein kinase HipA
MKYCPITYEPLGEDSEYSAEGLRLLNRNLKSLAPLEFSAEEQRQEAIRRAGKMSIQGLQLKLSAVLKVTEGRFEIVDRGGHFILKPQSRDFLELPENEDLTMRLAGMVGIEVPVHGLVHSADQTFTYFVKRFDREGRDRIPQEDFAQLSGASRDTKYDSSMEKVAGMINQYCTFPAIEKVKLWERTIFSFLVGNEDMHLKNFSLVTRDEKVELSPAYDFLSTTIAMKNAKEELALPLNGKKSNLTRRDLVDYFARERLGIQEAVLSDVLSRVTKALPVWHKVLDRSFLSADAKQHYASVLAERTKRMKL